MSLTPPVKIFSATAPVFRPGLRFRECTRITRGRKSSMKAISQAITSRTTYLMFGACALLMTGLAVEPASAQTQITDPETITKILKGFQISPVPINMQGKDPNLVGYGSYLVNAAGSCNDCHSAGAATEYAAPGIPYFGQQPTKVNPAVYMGGGNDFGAFPSSTVISHTSFPAISLRIRLGCRSAETRCNSLCRSFGPAWI